ncbi:MAG: endo-1,4-beta-xylanase [Oscillospiraceae bacterium]|nr:endo-1,4-beta-xylanase [Oscillospiraceae bacterium]
MKSLNKAAAALMSGVLALQGLPQIGSTAADGDILVTDFEDSDVSAFSKRGETDTSVIAASSEDSHSGKTCMSVTERSEGWNGPSVTLTSLGCEPGVQYVASAWVKMKWYNTVRLSMQYTDEEGEQHYDNLFSINSDNSWVEIPETKFSFSEDMKDVSIYIEGNDKADMWVDDFTLKKAPEYPIQEDIPGLKDVYADYFKIGCAVTARELAPNSAKALINKHFNSITLGNELKPENMLDLKATLAYLEESGDNTVPKVKLNGAARTILNFCKKNDIPVRGHVLVWYSQTPYWFFTEDYTSDGTLVDKDTMNKRMENYIKGVFEALEKDYSDVNFYAWDVVNEAFLDGGDPRLPGKYEANNGSSAWTAIYGDNSFIEPAFKYAREYAPKGCKLYYNDFNEYIGGKTDAMIKLATDLHEKGLLDGIGCQSHLNVTNNDTAEPFPSPGLYKSALAKFAETGLDIQITELDATATNSVANWDKLQAQYYSEIMDAIVTYKDSISAVVFWGTTDDQSWRKEATPLLFDEKYQAKSCFDSIIDGIEYTAPQPKQTEPKQTEPEQTATSSSDVPFIYGDADCNGDLDVTDAVLIARFSVGDNVNISDAGQLRADCDGVKGITSFDVLRVVKRIVDLVTDEQMGKVIE